MEALLQHLKDVYGNVYAVEVKDQLFFFRELSRKEYKQITEQVYRDDYQLEEAICEKAIVYPEEYDFQKRARAGTVKLLSTQIVTASGFAHQSQHVQMLEHYRYDMNNFDAQAETVIGLVFPNISEEEMADWTQERFMKKLARAEWVMKTIWGMPYEFGSQQPSEEDELAPEPPTIQEIGAELRQEGIDPMVALRESILSKRDHNYVNFPVIGGTKLLGNEEVLGNVRKQIQGLPK